MCRVLFFLGILSPLSLSLAGDNLNNDENRTEVASTAEVIRVIQPGVFDLKSTDFLIRMRAWGVGFPRRGEPGFEQALSFTEKHLLSTYPQITIRQEFDTKNLKVCEVRVANGSMNFSREAITLGIGWHLEDETGRFGPYLLAQLKAKRMSLGVWANDYNYSQQVGKVLIVAREFVLLTFHGLLNRLLTIQHISTRDLNAAVVALAIVQQAYVYVFRVLLVQHAQDLIVVP